MTEEIKDQLAPEEVLEDVKAAGQELTDEELEEVAGGGRVLGPTHEMMLPDDDKLGWDKDWGESEGESK
ncbi:MAG: hypothetical protein K6G78_04140 [bacterium]|nr:hypothetical protein [bacterium]